jgi:hypothetical protein
MATVPATPDLATMASIINTVLRGQVIVKTKIFSLRSRTAMMNLHVRAKQLSLSDNEFMAICCTLNPTTSLRS